MRKRQSSTLLDFWHANLNKARAQAARGDTRARLRVRVYGYLVRRYCEHPVASLPAQVVTSRSEALGHAPHISARVKVFRQQAVLRARASLRRLARVQGACE